MVSRSETSCRTRGWARICSGVISSPRRSVATGCVDVTALRVCAGDVDEHAALAFGRESGGVHLSCGSQGAAGVAELDGYGDLVQPDVRGSELGVVVVPAFAEPVGDLSCLVQVCVCGLAVVRA